MKGARRKELGVRRRTERRGKEEKAKRGIEEGPKA